MQTKKLIGLAVAVVVSVGLYFVVSSYVQTQERAGISEFDLEIRSRKLTLNPPVVKATQGDEVTLRIRSDEEGEFHVHTYDVEVEVEPGKSAVLRFNATLAGRFDFEWHLPKQAGQEKSEEIVVGAIEVSPKA